MKNVANKIKALRVESKDSKVIHSFINYINTSDGTLKSHLKAVVKAIKEDFKVNKEMSKVALYARQEAKKIVVESTKKKVSAFFGVLSKADNFFAFNESYNDSLSFDELLQLARDTKKALKPVKEDDSITKEASKPTKEASKLIKEDDEPIEGTKDNLAHLNSWMKLSNQEQTEAIKAKISLLTSKIDMLPVNVSSIVNDKLMGILSFISEVE